MKRHRFLILLIGILAITASSCNREKNLKCTDANTVKVPPHAMDYFYFKVGSWWVYECEQTGERDSMWVTKDYTDVSNPFKTKNECGCAKGLCFQEAYTQITNNFSLSKGLHYYLAYQMYHNSISTVDPKNQYGYLEVSEFYQPINLPGYKMTYHDNAYNNPSGNGAAITQVDSMDIKGVVYYDIFSYIYPTSGGYPDWYSSAWFAKNISLVRYIKTDKSIWNLVKYNIVK